MWELKEFLNIAQATQLPINKIDELFNKWHTRNPSIKYDSLFNWH